jgi:hypothetical protein
VDHTPCSRMPEHGGQQTVDRPARRRGAAGLEELPREIGEVTGTDIPYGEVAEALPYRGRAGLPGEQAAGACLGVTSFRGEPRFDGFRDRLVPDPFQISETALRRPSVLAGAQVLLLPTPLAVADEPDVVAGVPLVPAAPALLAEASHAAEFLRSESQKSSPRLGSGAYKRRRCSYGFPQFAGSSWRSAAEFCGAGG